MTQRIALVLAAALAACSQAHSPADGAASDAPSGLPTTAYVARDCAPDDGPALELLVYSAPVPDCSADPLQRSLRFYIFGGADPVFPISAPATITSAAGRANGSVTDCPGGTPPCRISSDFTITFDTYVELTSATGTYTVLFPDGAVSGRFEGTWCEVAPPLCG